MFSCCLVFQRARSEIIDFVVAADFVRGEDVNGSPFFRQRDFCKTARIQLDFERNGGKFDGSCSGTCNEDVLSC